MDPDCVYYIKMRTIKVCTMISIKFRIMILIKLSIMIAIKECISGTRHGSCALFESSVEK